MQRAANCCPTWNTETKGTVSPFLALMTDRGLKMSNSLCSAAAGAVALVARLQNVLPVQNGKISTRELVTSLMSNRGDGAHP